MNRDIALALGFAHEAEKYQPSKFTAIEGRWQTEQPPG
jgi:cytochrome bd-type quinol oxidase subunit 1